MTVFELGGADRVPNFSEQLWINGYIGGKQILDVKIAFFFQFNFLCLFRVLFTIL